MKSETKKGSDFISTGGVVILILICVVVALLFIVRGMYQEIRKLTAEIDYMQERLKALLERKERGQFVVNLFDEERVKLRNVKQPE